MNEIESRERPPLKAWIEAMRLRTLPVSVAGVAAGCGCAAMYGSFRPLPAVICLLFALLAQIASNFGNEYYDYVGGLDRKGREGFRRGVTEGDLSPSAMKHATFGVLAAACVLGCLLLLWGGWWLILVGIAIAIFAIAYSAGPYPLSHHGLGDIAVIIFFGLVPVTLTAYVQCGYAAFSPEVLSIAIAIGLLSDNILIVNNYRDIEDDRAVGKRTTAVIFGRRFMAVVYLIFGLTATALCAAATMPVLPAGWWVFYAAAALIWILLYIRLSTHTGAALNAQLGMTAVTLLFFSIILSAAQCQIASILSSAI